MRMANEYKQIHFIQEVSRIELLISWSFPHFLTYPYFPHYMSRYGKGGAIEYSIHYAKTQEGNAHELHKCKGNPSRRNPNTLIQKPQHRHHGLLTLWAPIIASRACQGRSNWRCGVLKLKLRVIGGGHVRSGQVIGREAGRQVDHNCVHTLLSELLFYSLSYS